MPAPIRDLIRTSEQVRFRVSTEPVHNALHSMMLLMRVDEVSGLDDWIVQTAENLPKEIMKQHAVIIYGVHYAVVPKRSYQTFEEYLEDLRASDPMELRDQLLDMYMHIPAHKDASGDLIELSKSEILTDFDTFITYLRSRFPPESIYEEIERAAFHLLSNPVEMHTQIISHLSMMWNDYFAEEFERRMPMINETVQAFRQFDFNEMQDEEVMQLVTGQQTEELCDWFKKHEQITFVPSPHTGPYTGPMMAGDKLWIMFNCRLPEGSPLGLSQVSRAEMLVWLTALADDTRLHILALLKEQHELCAQDIISMLDTSQSTASRHLRQLSASGFVREHRTEAGKCYRINQERFNDMISALQSFIA
jgi:DNA-binding transcriptional ArsR family regulator